MANNYTDHAELRFELNHPLMKRIVELKERDFRDKDTYDYAPLDFDDAIRVGIIHRKAVPLSRPGAAFAAAVRERTATAGLDGSAAV